MSTKTLSASTLAGLLDECQSAIGYTFQNPGLLRAAMTHTSGANTRQASNERLEFLGDSVLGLITCELLYQRFPDYQEGELTKVKSAVVSRRTCAEFSRELGLADFLILGKGVGAYGELPSNILADVYEALVAAVFLDGGFDAAKAFVLPLVEAEVERSAADAVGNNAKSQAATGGAAGVRRHPALPDPGRAGAGPQQVLQDGRRVCRPAVRPGLGQEQEGRRATGGRERPGRDRRQPGAHDLESDE